MLAMGYTQGQATIRITNASPNLDVVGGLATPGLTPCASPPVPGTTASATVSTKSFDWLLLDVFTPITPPKPQSKATMRCGG